MNVWKNVVPVAPRRRQTLADLHRSVMAKLVNIRPPLAIYPDDPALVRSIGVKEHIDHLDAVFEQINRLADFVADEAADHAGARREDIAILRAAHTDFVTPLREAVERLETER